jgi:colanic acid/amylovoran biosynthesis glycosyltransferase
MTQFAYLFERFPSFGQTFCYREVAELDRQGVMPPIFSIRKPKDEPPQDWDERIVQRVHYLPEEGELSDEIRRASQTGQLASAVVAALDEWGKRPDFLRLYQAIYVGRRLQKSGIRHVHAHFAGLAARTAFWIDRFFGIRFSFTAHANDIFAPRDFEVGLDKLIESASAVVTVSDFGVNYLKERFPARRAKIHRVYNGLDLSRFKRADLSESVPSIVGIGRLIEKKGFADLIRACALLKNRGREFHCEIIGDGPLENALRAQVEELGLQSQVVLAGPRPQSQVVEKLAGARVFVLPCVPEKDGAMDNLPTAIMEAMAAGLPVVSTPVGGIPEMVSSNRTGILVPAGDAAALADAIEKVIVDLSFARELGKRGYERAIDKFSVEKNARSLVALF